MRIRPYILAGGKSSRMGRDKAMLELAGQTLLARAVETLRGVGELKDADGRVLVTVVGERKQLEGADRCIADHYPGCGPLGGIEAALADLSNPADAAEGAAEADWAFFVPVDMPLLSATLLDRLLAGWSKQVRAANAEGREVGSCYAEVDGVPQPLVSLVHRDLHGPVLEALKTGRYKVVPLLKSGGTCCTPLMREADEAAQIDCRMRESFVQFTNVNTVADLMRVETLLKAQGLPD